MNPLLNLPNGTIVKIVSFLLSQRTVTGIRHKAHLREMGKKLGVEKVHLHKFRRTTATRAIEKGRMMSGGRQLCADRSEAEIADRASTENTWT